MKKAVVAAIVVMLLALSWLFWRTTRSPLPGLDPVASQAPAATAGAAGELGACDHIPDAPGLPATLSPPTADLPGIVAALDQTLQDGHKAWLRCYTLDDELLGRTQNGMGRWLRTTLHLTKRPELLKTLGASGPDEASSMIIIAYAAHLRGQELSPADAKTRRNTAMKDAGIIP